MGKIGGLILVTALALTGCSAATTATTTEAIEPASQVQPAANVQGDMLAALRPQLTTLQSTDSELMREAYSACANLLFRDKDAYRAAILAEHADLALGLDHLTVVAAAKQFLCR